MGMRIFSTVLVIVTNAIFIACTSQPDDSPKPVDIIQPIDSSVNGVGSADKVEADIQRALEIAEQIAALNEDCAQGEEKVKTLLHKARERFFTAMSNDFADYKVSNLDLQLVADRGICINVYTQYIAQIKYESFLRKSAVEITGLNLEADALRSQLETLAQVKDQSRSLYHSERMEFRRLLLNFVDKVSELTSNTIKIYEHRDLDNIYMARKQTNIGDWDQEDDVEYKLSKLLAKEKGIAPFYVFKQEFEDLREFFGSPEVATEVSSHELGNASAHFDLLNRKFRRLVAQLKMSAKEKALFESIGNPDSGSLDEVMNKLAASKKKRVVRTADK